MPGKRMPRWPLIPIALPAAVAIWSGWVGLGGLCGFGPVHVLPGINDGATVNTAICLPIGMEAYAAYALAVWLRPVPVPADAKRFAKRSALGALGLGLFGQVAFHLLTWAGLARAPVWVVVFVSCIPVAMVGLAAALVHLMSGEQEEPPKGDAGLELEQLLPAEFTDKLSAAEVAYRRSVAGGNPFTKNGLATRFEIPRPVAAEIVERVSAELAAYERSRDGGSPQPPPAVPAAFPPAGVARMAPPAPAGVNGSSPHV